MAPKSSSRPAPNNQTGTGSANNAIVLDSSEESNTNVKKQTGTGSANDVVALDSSDESVKKQKGKGREDEPEVPPGPFTDWRYSFSRNGHPKGWKLEDFPKTLYPEVHLEKPQDTWGRRQKGYPHVEDIYFIAGRNNRMEGNCYFGAISTLIYGSNQYWHTIKGHHLAFVNDVLLNKQHPRHTLYTQINARLSQRDDGGRLGRKANLWMRLNTPYAWQDGEILQITADLYDVFIIQYGMSEDHSKVENVRVRGNYNSTHLLVRFVDENHYEPLIPDEMPLSEFSFPEITRENTKGKTSVPISTPRQGATDLNHPWRSPMSRQEVPEQLFPKPRLPDMTPLEFSIVSGFNTTDSLMDLELYEKAREAAAENRGSGPPTGETTASAGGNPTLLSLLHKQS